MREVLAFALAFCASSCAMLTAAVATVKKVFLVFLLAATGALVGLPAGPVGAAIGAGAGACIGAMLDENVDLRSGALQGSGARDKEEEREIARLKSLLIDKDTSIKLISSEVGTAMAGKMWAIKWLLILLSVGFLWFCILRKKYLWAALTKKRVASRGWALFHAFTGFDWTRKHAYGFDPMEVVKK